MRIAICIIYVHDDVDVSAYEYVNVYADVYVNGYDIYRLLYIIQSIYVCVNDNDCCYCICVCI